jgi:hypothetical protein
MRVPKSKIGVLVVAIYLLLTLTVSWQVIMGKDYDSNFLLSILLTSPLSLILMIASHFIPVLNVAVFRTNNPYPSLMVILGLGALFNAIMLYLYISVKLRK